MKFWLHKLTQIPKFDNLKYELLDPGHHKYSDKSKGVLRGVETQSNLWQWHWPEIQFFIFCQEKSLYDLFRNSSFLQDKPNETLDANISELVSWKTFGLAVS